MTKERAVERLLHDFCADNRWRGFFENTVEELTLGADTLDIETYNAIVAYIRNMT